MCLLRVICDCLLLRVENGNNLFSSPTFLITVLFCILGLSDDHFFSSCCEHLVYFFASRMSSMLSLSKKTEKIKVGVEKFNEVFFIDEVIGCGGFGEVKKCRRKSNNEELAVKVFDLKKLNENEITEIKTEVKICLQLQHHNIVQLFDFYCEESFFYLIFELVTGGELFDSIIENERYSEYDASLCIQQVFDAVAYCHSKGIIHRDIKPENLMLASKDRHAPVKLIDFGLAVEGRETSQWHGFAGTPCYMAPEMLRRQPYNISVDCWACGCILYLLLVGRPPFWDTDHKKLAEAIKTGVYDFQSCLWQSVSFEAKSLIRQLLTVNCKRRMTASKALFTKWISERQRHASRKHRKNTIQRLKQFNARRKFKSAIKTVTMANMIASCWC